MLDNFKSSYFLMTIFYCSDGRKKLKIDSDINNYKLFSWKYIIYEAKEKKKRQKI